MVAQDRRRATEIIRILRRRYPQRRRGEVASTDARKPFEVMVSAIISQRNRDEVTEKVSDALLRRADTPDKILKLGRAGIAKTIHSANFYKTKARHILEAARMVKKEFGGRVPATREELMRLPGVGSKTTSIVLAYSFGVPTIAVDTHVNRVSKRLRFVHSDSEPDETQKVLEKIIPKKIQIVVNHLFVNFGKDLCRSLRPKCGICPIYDYCRYDKKEYFKNLPLEEEV